MGAFEFHGLLGLFECIRSRAGGIGVGAPRSTRFPCGLLFQALLGVGDSLQTGLDLASCLSARTRAAALRFHVFELAPELFRFLTGSTLRRGHDALVVGVAASVVIVDRRIVRGKVF